MFRGYHRHRGEKEPCAYRKQCIESPLVYTQPRQHQAAKVEVDSGDGDSSKSQVGAVRTRQQQIQQREVYYSVHDGKVDLACMERLFSADIPERRKRAEIKEESGDKRDKPFERYRKVGRCSMKVPLHLKGPGNEICFGEREGKPLKSLPPSIVGERENSGIEDKQEESQRSEIIAARGGKHGREIAAEHTHYGNYLRIIAQSLSEDDDCKQQIHNERQAARQDKVAMLRVPHGEINHTRACTDESGGYVQQALLPHKFAGKEEK